MKKKCWIAVGLWLGFVFWTAAATCVDVAPIGPDGSSVGFATVNGWFHRLTGVHMTLYTITDWLGLMPVTVGLGFALLGLCQWIHRRRFCRVDVEQLLVILYINIILAKFSSSLRF